MSFFRQFGHLQSAQAVLIPGTLSAALITPQAGEFVDVYSVVLETNDTAIQTVTVSDGTNTLATYFIGGLASGASSIVDIGTIPVRGKRGGTITVAAGAVTAAKSISVKVTGLTSKT